MSPELALIDPELARREVLMPAVWETVRVAQQAAREPTVHEDDSPANPGRRRRRWLVLIVAAAIIGAGAVAALALGVFSDDSQTAVSKVAPPRPAAKHPVAKKTKASLHPAARPAHARSVTTPRVARHSAPKASTPARHTKPAPSKTQPHVPSKTQPHAASKPKPQVTSPRVAPKPKPQAKSPPAASAPKPHVVRHVGPAPFTPGPKTFVWAKVPGATGYRIAFYKGPHVILVRRTQAPRVVVPSKWRHAGKVETLAPGRYQWYVWSLDSHGHPSASTVVSSTIMIGH